MDRSEATELEYRRDTTKDLITGIKTNELDGQSILIELPGEFDLVDLKSLRTVLKDGALSSGRPIWLTTLGPPFSI